MFPNLGTFFLYNTIIATCCLLVKVGKTQKKKAYVIFAYAILFFLSAIRFDIGNDYENFYNDIRYMSDITLSDILLGNSAEISISSLMTSCITALIPHNSLTPVFVIAIFAAVFFIFYYKSFSTFQEHSWAIVLLFLLLYLFKSWDWIKQGVAISIILYSFNYINRKDFLHFSLCVFFASLWHLSAIVTIILYPLSTIKIAPRTLSYILLAIFMLTELGLFRSIYEMIISNVPYYKEIYEMSRYSEFDGYNYHTKTFIITSLWYLFIIRYCPDNCENYIMPIFIGAAIFMVSSGSLLLDRVGMYFSVCQLLVIPSLVNSFSNKKKLKIVFASFILFHFLLFNYQVFLETGLQGSNKYDTVFSQNYEELKFRYRDYYYSIN